MNYRLRSITELEEINEHFLTKRYKARVPTMALMDEEEIAIFGFYQQHDMNGKPMLLTSNVEDTNRVTVEVMWQLPKLIDTFYNGFPMTITDTDENCLEMFKNLESYIHFNASSHTLSLNQMTETMEASFFMQVEHFLASFLELNRATLEKENSSKFRSSGLTLGMGKGLVGDKLNMSGDKIESSEDEEILGASNLNWRYQ